MPGLNAGDDDGAQSGGIGTAGVGDGERRVMIQVSSSSGSGRAQNLAPRPDEVIAEKRRPGIGQTRVIRIPPAPRPEQG